MNLGDTYRGEEVNNTLVSKIKQLKAHYGIMVSEAVYNICNQVDQKPNNYQTEDDDEDGEPQSPPFPRSSDVISPPSDPMPYNTETPTLHRTTAENVGTPRNALIRRASTFGRMRSKVRIACGIVHITGTWRRLTCSIDKDGHY